LDSRPWMSPSVRPRELPVTAREKEVTGEPPADVVTFLIREGLMPSAALMVAEVMLLPAEIHAASVSTVILALGAGWGV
jgi:hypothetical protein